MISTIIARSRALLDWQLWPWVDVSVTNTSTSCYPAWQIDANVNACGQTCHTLLMDTREALMVLVPSLLSWLFAYQRALPETSFQYPKPLIMAEV